VIPAVDVRDGACVQLVGGDPAAESVRRPDPLAEARRWRALGYPALHVVDLDAALGTGSNEGLIEALAALPDTEVQVGGGLRDDDALARVFAAGAVRAVVGTRALADPEWLAAAAARHPGRLVAALDVRGREVVTRGWRAGTGRDVRAALDALAPLPLAAVLVTAVHAEGRMAGPDVALVRELVGATRVPLQASGGVAGRDDLRRLAAAGAAAVIVGMALYTGALAGRALTEVQA
jgi:phosphoribosylformimino-5-aminoimidazole carboxamide ribotide isomerase